ncbi:MAG: ABC transporter ATP-binding protein, partial [Acidobacteriota bacterium]
AGKSTTLRMLIGLVQPDRGSVEVLGHRMPEQQDVAKRHVGFVYDDLGLYDRATLGWHIDFVRSMFGSSNTAGPWDTAYAEQLLRRFDLHLAQKVGRMSRGQRVKAALLLALARRPKLLILDEPTAGLDPIARREVLTALTDVLEDSERTVLFSSQNTLDIEQISDQITFIDRGRVVTSADKESLLEDWRALRVRVPPGATLPAIPGVTRDGGSERIARLTAQPFEPAIVQELETAGVHVEAVERMTLEEIFVACVMRQRVGVEA